MSIMRALVIEDELRIADNVAAALREGLGWAVDVAGNGIAGRDRYRETDYDLIVLDLILPRLNGLGVLQSLRESGKCTPVLILTATVESSSVVQLLNAGADDYLGKPFDVGELLARAKALTRRGKSLNRKTVHMGPLILDKVEQSVSYQDRPILLSIVEYRVLEYLGDHRSTVVSKRALCNHIYDYDWELRSNAVEVHISNVRKKLNQVGCGVWIETVRGKGYRLIIPRCEAAS